MIKAILIPVDGPPEKVGISAVDQLAAVQGYVEGWVEAIPLSENAVMLVDEEGKLSGKKPNRLATALWLLTTPQAQLLRGSVVVAGSPNAKGAWTSCPAGVTAALEHLGAAMHELDQ